ncbi:MAG: twin-arginine translocation signal domain-containing protein [Gemmatimonadetes bacterium]|nr:twin-arginine translocation signal domain-containing protein [Gemmatimonadota bacterium]
MSTLDRRDFLKTAGAQAGLIVAGGSSLGVMVQDLRQRNNRAHGLPACRPRHRMSWWLVRGVSVDGPRITCS